MVTTQFFIKNIFILDCTLHYGWTLSTGEAKPPRADMTSVIKALSHDVTILAFVPLSLIPLEALLCIESEAADALATLHSMCFSL